MIASLVVLALLLLGFAWWVVVQPHDRSDRARDSQLPLFSARTPGSALRVVGAARPAGARASAPPVTPAAAAAPVVAAAASEAPVRPATRRTPFADREVNRPRADETAPAFAPPPASPVARPQVAPAPLSFAEGATMHDGSGPPSPAARADAAPPRSPVPGAAPSLDGALSLEPPPVGDAKWAPQGATIPANGTVQFLPGRLEVVQGRGVAGQEVRFVRPSRAGERAVVTFGRGEGPPYRHVQLNVPTVSRLHARLSMDEATGNWSVENLSSTNPTVINGDELRADVGPRPLADGDRIEMGEVLFTFHTQ